MRMNIRFRALALLVAVSLGACSKGDDDDTCSSAAVPVEPPACCPDCSPNANAWYQPSWTTTWQWQLSGSVNTTYDVQLYDIDLFDGDPAVIDALHDQGRRVICYFSAGSSENWRSDFAEFDRSDRGKALDGWVGEEWLDIRSANVRRIMVARLDLAKAKQCDGVEPDNVDGYANRTGFPLTADDQLDYNRFLAEEAHARNLAIGLKNDGAQAAELVDYFDFSLNEECHAYCECAELSPFIRACKPVFNVEYADSRSEAQELAKAVCLQAGRESFRTLIMPWELDDSFRIACDGL